MYESHLSEINHLLHANSSFSNGEKREGSVIHSSQAATIPSTLWTLRWIIGCLSHILFEIDRGKCFILLESSATKKGSFAEGAEDSRTECYLHRWVMRAARKGHWISVFRRQARKSNGKERDKRTVGLAAERPTVYYNRSCGALSALAASQPWSEI